MFTAQILSAQEKLCYNVFYTSNSGFQAKKFDNILLVTNAPFQAVDEMRKIAKDEKYNVIIYTDIFPPVKNYSDEEISIQVLNYGIDGILFLNVAGEEAQKYEYKFGTYEYVKIPAENEKKKVSEIDGTFIEPANRKSKIFSCTGTVNDIAIPSSFKVFANILKRFPDVGVQRPEKVK
jgi:hypothetical protein